ncbi:hypothetical protein M404DRAFT_24556 [Pisolithus tinctorius Marx 270]|uniref:Uncharacterized protein n=1 Tax=Pisolithus tinctorius Marx 270 TaxID=870435 RepID=A0A0C3PEK1_PISTI|nr:hypothetical protein M404DRAFT_24556 [Pisolithus tinctorius Marx 270]
MRAFQRAQERSGALCGSGVIPHIVRMRSSGCNSRDFAPGLSLLQNGTTRRYLSRDIKNVLSCAVLVQFCAVPLAFRVFHPSRWTLPEDTYFVKFRTTVIEISAFSYPEGFETISHVTRDRLIQSAYFLVLPVCLRVLYCLPEFCVDRPSRCCASRPLLPTLKVLSSYLAHSSTVPLAFPAVRYPRVALSGDTTFVKFRADTIEIRSFLWLEALSDNFANILGPHRRIPSVSFSACSLNSPPLLLAVSPYPERPSLVCSVPLFSQQCCMHDNSPISSPDLSLFGDFVLLVEDFLTIP